MAKWRLILNSLKLFRILFHFAFFLIHSITTFSLVDTKRQTGTFTVVEEKNSFEGTLWLTKWRKCNLSFNPKCVSFCIAMTY